MMALNSDNMVTWLNSRQESPTPDPDAIKLLQFLDTAALSIRMTLQKSSNPKGKRLPKDNARALSKRRMLGESVFGVNVPRSTEGKRRKLTTRQEAHESFNSLFDIDHLGKPTKHQNNAIISQEKNSPSEISDKSLLNRDLPLSFFVEPALRGRRQIDLNTGCRFVHSSYQNFNTDSKRSPHSEDSHESRSRSPSLPEDTLESILDQGEINHLLFNHRWHHDVGAITDVCSVKFDSSASGSWVTGAELTAATPSPQTCSESSRDSFFSTAPPMTPEWFQGADLTPPTCSSGPCPNTTRNLASFENRLSPFQIYGYPKENGNNIDETALLSRNQTHSEWEAQSNSRGTNAIHTAHYFNVRVAPIRPLEIPRCFASQCRHTHFSAESSVCLNPKASNYHWSSPCNQLLSWSNNS